MIPPFHLVRLGFVMALLALPSFRAVAAEADAMFKERVLPLLAKHCHECHSHAAKRSRGDLVLDSFGAILTGGQSGPAIVPGAPETSLLLRAVRHESAELKMPQGKAKLSDADIALLTDWIRQVKPPVEGAGPVTADWWSLKPLVRPAIPSVGNRQSATGNRVDRFLAAKLREHHLTPAPDADSRTLIRRLHFGLTGLPPSPEEVEAFEREFPPSLGPSVPPSRGRDGEKERQRENAYAAVVDRLLASPHYGERWARHWFDIIHFADTHGFEHDLLRTNAWRYRDYVIAAFNRDVPWQRFIREQLAADVFYPLEPQLKAALGFLGAGPLDTSTQSTAPRTFDYLDRDDLVTQTMAAFASTTANCARCHAHKFDPISQEDYYALQAVFAGITKADVPFEDSPAIGQQRRHWQALLAAANTNDATVLLTSENAAAVARWEERHGQAVTEWRTLALETFASSDGSTLKAEADGSVSSSGTRPEKDTYTATGTTTFSTVTALRLEVLASDALPKKGPGRQDNGHLHLSEVEVRLLPTGSTNATRLKIKRATADFNQDGWTIAHALDGNEKTAWGIYPRVGESHLAVFEFESPVALTAGAKLVVALKQLHGGGHLIGRFRLSATDSPNANAEVVPPLVAAGLKLPRDQRTPEQRLAIAAHALRQHAQDELAKLPAPASVFAVKAGMEPKAVHLLKRGDIHKPGAEVGPGALSAVADLPARFALAEPKREAMRRVALADWLADPRNPVTWRSAATRVWHYHFGRGLCDTPSDFGRMGSVPSHPELLDWLACELRDSGSLKHLHRLIVTSEVYRRSSVEGRGPRAFDSRLSTLDPENKLLWRMNRSRLDAETFRDAVLAVSGRLDRSQGGPGVQHFALSKGPQATPKVDYTPFDWDAPGAGRRSIYRVVWRGIADPFMEALDFPDASLLQPTRNFSASALQALALFNNDFVLRHSEHFAARVEKLSGDTASRVRAAVRLAYQRAATAEEVAAMSAYAEQHGFAALGRVLFNSNECLFIT
ncbi:MAG: PSD1 and planctomycete cytochrome C domain-containing protein [Limisphaerales bacterium]